MKSTKLGAWALSFLLLSGLGCSVQTGTKVAQDIVSWTPALTSAVATIDATGAMLDPAATVIFAAATAGFDAVAQLVVADAKAYLANPTASVLADLQTAITTLEQQVNAGIIAAAKITNSASQKLALAAMQGVLTAASTILALVQTISTKAELRQMSDDSPIKLAAVRPYLDQHQIETAAARYGATPDQFFSREAQAGF